MGNGQARARPMSPEKCTLLDNAIDDVLKKVRVGNGGERASLEAFIHAWADDVAGVLKV